MATRRTERLVRELLDRYGTTYAAEAGITLADKPSPLYRLLVLGVLLSSPISAGVAVATARELSRSGLRTPAAMAAATWQQRVDALGRGGYRRFDERTATQLGDGADLLTQRWAGDLRRLHAESGGDVEALRKGLQAFPGVGPTGSAIVCREVQAVWPDVAPFVDERVQRGAGALGLPTSPPALARLVDAPDLPRLASACVRASLDDSVVDAVRHAVDG